MTASTEGNAVAPQQFQSSISVSPTPSLPNTASIDSSYDRPLASIEQPGK
ncbi:MAG TPA: hypothetical protein VKP64_06255 [Mycobacteriales bacterium]|nr:hypothetical protein [Mycobacteriales bacterium]